MGVVNRTVLLDIFLKRGQTAKTKAFFFQQKRGDQTTDPTITVGEGVDLFEDKLGNSGDNGGVIVQSLEIFNIFVH